MHALRMFCLFLVALWIAACTNNYEAPGIDKGPADTASQTDSGSEDSDADTDADSDMDTDSDSDADTDTDTDADSDSDTDTTPDDCTDGVDNDGDGYQDSEDPGCTDGDGSELPYDEPEEVEETSEDCWNSMPFTLFQSYVDFNLCASDFEGCFITTDWNSLSYVDIEIVRLVNAYTASAEVSVYSPDDGAIEADVFLPTVTDWTSPTTLYNQESDNQVVAVLEPDGKATEFSYFSFSGGTYRGYVLPDDDANRQDVCTGNGYDLVNWISGHGGPHSPSATQAWRECELTGDCEIMGPKPIEVDKTHLSAMSDDPDCSDGYTGLAASADSYYASGYTGTVQGLCMGSFLTIPPTWNDVDEDGVVDFDPNWDHSGLVNDELTYYDCSSNMQSTVGVQYCVAASQYFLYIIDDSGGVDELQLPVAMEVESDGSYNDVIAEVVAATGVDLVNAWYENNPDGEDGPYECDGDEDETVAWAEDANLIMSLVKVFSADVVVMP